MLQTQILKIHFFTVLKTEFKVKIGVFFPLKSFCFFIGIWMFPVVIPLSQYRYI